MLKFGKRVNYRPLFFSSFVAMALGLLFGLNIDKSLGFEVGIIMFSLMILGHYLIALPILFNYWDINGTQVRYSNIKRIPTRILTIFFPKLLSLKTINKKQIISIDLLGLPQQKTNLSSELVVPEEGGFTYNLLLMMNEPVKVRLVLVDNSTVDLDLSRDYVDCPHETIKKINLFLNEFDPSVIDISIKTRRFLSE